jgi:pyridoxamine 5'-phosphate oxidase
MSFVNPHQSTIPPVLLETEAPADPLALFRAWWDQALAASLVEPGAMTLATATPEGLPSARMVLLRGFDERGFVFFTNYKSRKAEELTANPRAALVLYWAELDRQVRIEGRVNRVSAEESDAYFQTRARGSQLGAWASPQSHVIVSREFLLKRMEELATRYPAQVPRPPLWGGFRVVPAVIEFWQGQPNRLHDRLQYRRRRPENGGWVLERLAP